MNRQFQRLIPIAALLAVFAGVAPATAQRSNPSPNPGTNTSEVCAQVGLALAVIGDTSVAAEAMGHGARSTIGSRAPAALKVVANAPAAVGACAEYQAFWGDNAAGTAEAKLTLFDANGGALASDVAVGMTAHGPNRLNKSLKALTKLADPGTYDFVALIEVKASKPGNNNGVSAAEAQDALKVAFSVEVRQRGQPQPQPEPGFIAGTVRNADGGPIEGARVNVARGSNTVTPRRPIGTLPVVPGIPYGGAGAVDQARNPGSAAGGAISGPDGTYRLATAPGKYLVTAGADGYLMQWYKGAAGSVGATVVEVKAGETTADIDFSLSPKPMATISGMVTKAGGGGGAANIMVIAVLRQNPSPQVPSTRAAASARTDADGKYTLKVEPGTYAVGASQPATTGSRAGRTIWWDGKADPNDADLIELAANAAREGIDFTLP